MLCIPLTHRQHELFLALLLHRIVDYVSTAANVLALGDITC